MRQVVTNWVDKEEGEERGVEEEGEAAGGP